MDRTYEALAIDWDHAAVADHPPLRRLIEALCHAGTHVFVVSDESTSTLDSQLTIRPNGPGTLHLCVSDGSEIVGATHVGLVTTWPRPGPTGFGRTSQPDVAHWISDWLTPRGITGSLILVVGEILRSDTRFHRTPSALAAVATLEEQLRRRSERRVPHIDDDDRWVVRLPEETSQKRVAEALGALSNGWLGTRAALEEDGPLSAPLVVVNGCYTTGSEPHLLAAPQWTSIDLPAFGAGATNHRQLDLRTGVLTRFVQDDDRQLRTVRLVSAARAHALGMRAETAPALLSVGEPLAQPSGQADIETDCGGELNLARARDAAGSNNISLAGWQRVRDCGDRTVIERLAAWHASQTDSPTWSPVVDKMSDLQRLGFDRLLADHRAAWARRWADAEVTIDGNAGDELAARFAVFHLLGCAPDSGEAAVGARGLTGEAYGGHVFWDADVFVLPALAAIRPGAARAMLEYRIRRLPIARAAAHALGRRGARFPWESAGSGADVTPRQVLGRRGEVIPIRTGQHEEHIVADIAWASDHYASWTGDRAFAEGPGADLIVQGARYWASRVRSDPNGTTHIDQVMGPDEYHEIVDDNAYTNVMARWNLRRGADLLAATHNGDEADEWRSLANTLVDGWDRHRSLYEQFAGYWELEPLLVANVAKPPVAVDVLLGSPRVSGSQLIKQPDVLMLHHLVPEEVVSGSLEPCLTFYEPRCAHGSSLSPAIHASLLARAGQPDHALSLFRVAARLDLDDLTGTTAGGVHLATMGGVWQALAFGFLGLRAVGEVLTINPCLPAEWTGLALRFRFRGQPVGVRGTVDFHRVMGGAPLVIRLGTGETISCESPGQTVPFERRPR